MSEASPTSRPTTGSARYLLHVAAGIVVITARDAASPAESFTPPRLAATVPATRRRATEMFAATRPTTSPRAASFRGATPLIVLPANDDAHAMPPVILAEPRPACRGVVVTVSWPRRAPTTGGSNARPAATGDAPAIPPRRPRS